MGYAQRQSEYDADLDVDRERAHAQLSVVPTSSFIGMQALRVAAGLLRTLRPQARVYLPAASSPSQRALLEAAGFALSGSFYLPGQPAHAAFSAMLATLCRIPPASVVMMHTSIRKEPGSYTREQWSVLADACKAMRHFPLLEISSRGLQRAGRDSAAVHGMAEREVPFMLMHLGVGRIAISVCDRLWRA